MLKKMHWAEVKSGGDTLKSMNFQQVSWAARFCWGNISLNAALHYGCHFLYELLLSCQIYLPFRLKAIIWGIGQQQKKSLLDVNVTTTTKKRSWSTS